MKKMTVMIGIIISFITIIGAMFALDARWTRANITEELKQSLCNKDGELLNKIAGNHKRMEQYIAQDRYNWLEERKYKLEDRYDDPSVAVIAMSGFFSEYDKTFCLSAGFSDFLEKPVDTNELNSALQCAFERRSRWMKIP